MICLYNWGENEFVLYDFSDCYVDVYRYVFERGKKKKRAVFLLDGGLPQECVRVMILLHPCEFWLGSEPHLPLHCRVRSDQGYRGTENGMQPICPLLAALWKEFLSDAVENLGRLESIFCCPFRLLRFEASFPSYLAYLANFLTVDTKYVLRSF